MQATQTKTNPQFFPSNNYADGSMLVYKPSKKEFEGIKEIVTLINNTYKEMGIRNFVPVNPEHLHITFYSGLSNKITAAEKEYIMNKVAKKISNMQSLFFNIQFGNQGVKIENPIPTKSTTAYTLLKFPSDSLVSLQKVVFGIIEKGIKKNKINQDAVDMAKLASSPEPHLTLGVIENNNDPLSFQNDMQILKNAKAKASQNPFNEKTFKVLKRKNYNFNLNVNSISYISINDLKAEKKNKKYTECAKAYMGKPVVKPVLLQPQRAAQPTTPVITSPAPVQQQRAPQTTAPVITSPAPVQQQKAQKPAAATLTKPKVASPKQNVQPAKTTSHAAIVNSKYLPSLKTFKETVTNITGETQFSLSHQVDRQTGQKLLCVNFLKRDSAQRLFNTVSGGKGSIQTQGPYFVVRFGADRMENLFGQDGEKVLNNLTKNL